MWWIFGLINVVIVVTAFLVYHCKIKENPMWFKENKVAFGTMLVVAFLSGFVGTMVLGGLLIYLVVDFVRYVRK